jgi:uncharacterized membrane protein YGL010W
MDEIFSAPVVAYLCDGPKLKTITDEPLTLTILADRAVQTCKLVLTTHTSKLVFSSFLLLSLFVLIFSVRLQLPQI